MEARRGSSTSGVWCCSHSSPHSFEGLAAQHRGLEGPPGPVALRTAATKEVPAAAKEGLLTMLRHAACTATTSASTELSVRRGALLELRKWGLVAHLVDAQPLVLLGFWRLL